MPPNLSDALLVAARRRHETTRAKAIKALRELDHHGTAITFTNVARTAGISRSWLYTQPDLRKQIQQRRDTTARPPSPAIPATQRTTDDSLRRRLEQALQRNRELTEENQRLRRQLAHALGDQRLHDRTTTPPTPEHR